MRIYHPYWLWEDYKSGFYNNPESEKKESYKKSVLELFNDESVCRKWMFYVIDNWKYSCEHNLTNDSLNQIAWIGQSACCCYGGVPNSATMEYWSLLDKNIQDRADSIAMEVIKEWNKRNKKIQLCLNF